MMNYIHFFIYWFWIILTIFFLLNNPLVMGLILIINTFFLCMFIVMFSFSSWNSYILFLMFLGGVLILFLYNISLISSEMFFYLNFKDMFMLLTLTFFFYIFNFKESMLNDMMNFIVMKNSSPIMFLFFNTNTILFLMIYLFFSLICVVNLVYFFKDKGSILFKI